MDSKADVPQETRDIAAAPSTHTIHGREHATILAALRYYEAALANGDEVGEDIDGIASNGNAVEPLRWQEIDGLCVRLNTEREDVGRPAIRAVSWEKTGSDEDPTSRLSAQIGICGLPMHLEAYALNADSDEQRIADPLFADVDECFFRITDTAVCTLEIDGREYALIATPHGS